LAVKKYLLLASGVKAGGGGGEPCVLEEHANAEQVVKGNINSWTAYYTSFANGATLCTCTITTTARCCIVFAASTILYDVTGASIFQIQRGGVNKTLETTISAADANKYRTHLLYGTEVLDAGVYTYNLVNTSGSAKNVQGSAIKAVGVACVLVENANAEQAVKSTTTSSNPRYQGYDNGATLATCTINTTKQTMIVIIAMFMANSDSSGQIQRGGVDKTLEANASAADASFMLVRLFYGVEVLAAGNYTYNLVNTWGSAISVIGSTIKAVAVEA